MRIFGETCQIADTEMAGTSTESIAKSESAECGITTGTAATNCQALAINKTTLDKILSAIYAVVNIHDTPLIFEALAIGSAITRTATIIHVQCREAPASPELYIER